MSTGAAGASGPPPPKDGDGGKGKTTTPGKKKNKPFPGKKNTSRKEQEDKDGTKQVNTYPAIFMTNVSENPTRKVTLTYEWSEFLETLLTVNRVLANTPSWLAYCGKTGVHDAGGNRVIPAASVLKVATQLVATVKNIGASPSSVNYVTKAPLTTLRSIGNVIGLMGARLNPELAEVWDLPNIELQVRRLIRLADAIIHQPDNLSTQGALTRLQHATWAPVTPNDPTWDLIVLQYIQEYANEHIDDVIIELTRENANIFDNPPEWAQLLDDAAGIDWIWNVGRPADAQAWLDLLNNIPPLFYQDTSAIAPVDEQGLPRPWVADDLAFALDVRTAYLSATQYCYIGMREVETFFHISPPTHCSEEGSSVQTANVKTADYMASYINCVPSTLADINLYTAFPFGVSVNPYDRPEVYRLNFQVDYNSATVEYILRDVKDRGE